MASERKLDSARRVGGKIIEQGQPAGSGLIRRYCAEFLMMRLRRFNMNIADRGRKMAGRLFRRVADPQPVAHIKGEGDRQLMDPAGGFEALHRRQLAAVGLVIFHHQRHAAVAENIAQGVQLLIVEEMAKREFQPQGIQGLCFREQRRESRVELAVVSEQRLRLE